MKSKTLHPLWMILASALPATAFNISLPSGWTWEYSSSSNYTSDTKYTEQGGKDGQTAPPYNDTSYGVMNEPGATWATGHDQSDQQFIQQQVFGNYGTNYLAGPPQLGVPGTRFYNNGTPGTNTVGQVTPNNGYDSGTGQTSYNAGATSAGQNFPSNAKEIRSVSIANWNNPLKDDASRPVTAGMQIYVPTSAVLYTSRGYGADEMYMGVVGGLSAQNSTFRMDFNIYSMMWSTMYGVSEGYDGANRDYLNGNVTLTVKDAGPGGDYGMDGSERVPFGYAIDTMDPSFNTANVVDWHGGLVGTDNRDSAVHQALQAGIPQNSVGGSIDQTFNIAAGDVAMDGSSFTVNFESHSEMWVSRQSGEADARFNMGPGMAGNAYLVVNYDVYTATVPEPSAALLGTLGALGICLRRRR